MQNEKMDEISPKFLFVVDIFLVSFLFENNREKVCQRKRAQQKAIVQFPLLQTSPYVANRR